jgi:glycosyltransferase involved in cell wall biosynthesis
LTTKPDSAAPLLLHLQGTAGYGGDESNSTLLIRHLSGHRHHVAVNFRDGPMSAEWRRLGAAVTPLDLLSRSRRSIPGTIASLIDQLQPAAVFLSSVSLLPLFLKGLEGCRGPVLVHTGNPNALTPLARFKFRAARWLLRVRTPAIMVHCSHYVAGTYAADPLFKAYRHEVAVSAGVAAPRIPHVPRARTPGHELLVGMTARLDRIKHHALVLEAWPAVLRAWPEARLEFVGDGAERAALQARAQRLGIAAAVTFLGRVPETGPIMERWDLFVYATTASEGFGAALAEAMALGLPCIVTDIGPMREVGGDEGAVRYVGATDAPGLAATIVDLGQARPARQELSRRAVQRAESHFRGEVFAARIGRIIHDFGGGAS